MSSSRRPYVLWYLAPALLVGVAGLHAYFAAAQHQTPWEGGGFGMFSTVDKRQARFLRCSIVTPNDTARVQLPSHLYTYVERLRARPSQARVEALAQYLAEATWVVTASDSGRTATEKKSIAKPQPRYRFLPSHEVSERPRATVMAARVEVWRYQLGRRPYGLVAGPLASATQRRERTVTSE